MSQIRARHILVNGLTEAMDIHNKITKQGESFDTMALRYSMCPSRHNGGDLGMFGRGQMVKPFEDAVFGLEVGQISTPVQTQFGYHLIERIQ